MSKEELKELIYNLEDILKLDKRFKKNGDNKYKKTIKNIYINSTTNGNKCTYLNPIVVQQPIEQKYPDYDFLVKVDKSLDELNKLAKNIK